MTSTIKPNKLKLWSILLWLAIWEIASLLLSSEILLVSPFKTFSRFLELSITLPFWQSIIFSLSRIALGFLSAFLLGTLLAMIAIRLQWLYDFLAPIMLLLKSTPVASFIILILIWIPSKNLSIFISFIMVLPVIYVNVYHGMRSINHQLIDMANVFRITPYRKIRYIYFPQIMPFLLSACQISLGLCWKAGIAAEVIGIPKGSIGEKLYNAKIYLETPDLFAWTFVIIFVSILFEKVILFLLKIFVKYLERI